MKPVRTWIVIADGARARRSQAVIIETGAEPRSRRDRQGPDATAERPIIFLTRSIFELESQFVA